MNIDKLIFFSLGSGHWPRSIGQGDIWWT